MKSENEIRKYTGRLLSQKLDPYRNTDAVVVGIPTGGVCIASEITRQLSLPLWVLPCRRIKHPSDDRQSIGSVSMRDIHLNSYAETIPQEYIYHQIALLRNALEHDQKQYNAGYGPPSFTRKTVIMVVESLHSADAILACVRSLRKEDPHKIVVAIPVVTPEAARILRSEADEVVFLQTDAVIQPIRHYFADLAEAVGEVSRERSDATAHLVTI